MRATQIGENQCQVPGETVKDHSKNLLLDYKEGELITVFENPILEAIQNHKNSIYTLFLQFPVHGSCYMHMISCPQRVRDPIVSKR